MLSKLLRGGTLQVSRPKRQVLHGIEIKKQPVGRYLDMMERSGAILFELLDAAFPGRKPAEVLELLTQIDAEQLRELFVRLAGLLPRKLVAILREIVGAKDNPCWDELTLSEMMAVCKAFWDLNDLTGFFETARSLGQQLIRPELKTDDTGSNG